MHFVGQILDNGCVLANVFSRVVQLLFCVQFHEYLVYVVYTLSHNNIYKYNAIVGTIVKFTNKIPCKTPCEFPVYRGFTVLYL